MFVIHMPDAAISRQRAILYHIFTMGIVIRLNCKMVTVPTDKRVLAITANLTMRACFQERSQKQIHWIR